VAPISINHPFIVKQSHGHGVLNMSFSFAYFTNFSALKELLCNAKHHVNNVQCDRMYEKGNQIILREIKPRFILICSIFHALIRSIIHK